MTPVAVHGQVKSPASSAPSRPCTARAPSTVPASDSHHAGIGRHSASTTAPPCAIATGKASAKVS